MLRGSILIICLGFLNIGLSREIIPQPKIKQDGKEGLAWELLNTTFYLDFESSQFQTPKTARAITLLREIPIKLNEHLAEVRIKIAYRAPDAPTEMQIMRLVGDSLVRKKEGYFLQLSNHEIIIYGFDEAGVLYAVQSLRQILAHWIAGNKIPPTTIIDYPTFSFRGVLDDISRGPLSNLDFIKEQIRRLSLLKINVLTFYIEHVVKTKAHYSYAPEDALTLEEIDLLSIYADSFNIQLMGSFQSLGHFKHILADPKYQHLGVSERMLKPGDENALKYLKEIYNELLPRFTHQIFNINGDEAYDLERGSRLKHLSERIGRGKIYLDHVNPLLMHIKSMNRLPGLWGDVLLQHPETIEKLPAGTVVFTWNYEARQNFEAFITPFINDRIDCIVAPGVVNSYRLWPDLVEAVTNIAGFAYDGWRLGAKGVLTTVWDDGGRHFFATDWYGIAAGAAHSWNPEIKSIPSFPQTFFNTFYGGEGSLFSIFLQNLAELQATDQFSKLDNSILSVDFDPHEEEPVYFDTSETSEILKKIGVIKQSLEEIETSLNKKSKLLFSLSDFQYWNFKLRELDLAVRTPMALLHIQEMLSLANPSDEIDRSTLQEVTGAVRSQVDQWSELSHQFRFLSGMPKIDSIGTIMP